MVTITSAVHYAIARQARVIHDLKSAALSVEAYEKYCYVSPDGKSFSTRRPADPEKADWKLTKVRGERVVRHISPKSAEWRQYCTARNHASLLLTARLILKRGNEAVPSMAELRHALGDGGISHHARRGHSRRLAFKSYRYLRKLANRLERKPEAFGEAESWVARRNQAVREARREPELRTERETGLKFELGVDEDREKPMEGSSHGS